jgi:hypothetical protein
MNSEKLAGLLGAVVAVIVLAAAFYYSLGQRALAPKPPVKVEQPQVPSNQPPVARGPVVREVPQ